jgi:hypothetical protein
MGMTSEPDDKLIKGMTGPYRTIFRYNKWYVVGHNILIPATDEDEANKIVATLKKKQEN